MPLLFTEVVFDETFSGNTPVLSSARFTETLGRADKLIVQVRVIQASGTSPTWVQAWCCGRSN